LRKPHDIFINRLEGHFERHNVILFQHRIEVLLFACKDDLHVTQQLHEVLGTVQSHAEVTNSQPSWSSVRRALLDFWCPLDWLAQTPDERSWFDRNCPHRARSLLRDHKLEEPSLLGPCDRKFMKRVHKKTEHSAPEPVDNRHQLTSAGNRDASGNPMTGDKDQTPAIEQPHNRLQK
jgi:hypothetical protein